MEKIFAKDIDQNTKKQFENCLSESYVLQGALMPDAHLGYVAPIGSVLITKGFIVPSWVGYDMGCGVTATKIMGKSLLPKVRKYSEAIFDEIKKEIPMGLGKLNAEHKVSKETKKDFGNILAKLEKQLSDKELFKWIKRKSISNLGTLGHGNHFIEIDYSKNEVWLVVHSGSRNIGHHTAEYFMIKAKEEALLQNKKIKEKDYVGTTKTGFTGPIDNSEAKENFEATYPLKISSKIGKEYLAALDFCLEFALLNRIEITKKVVLGIEKVLGEKINFSVWANKNHNNAERIGKTDKFVHRKGATPSKKGEKGVIPGNMRDGSYLVIGKGNKKFLNSSSHGAGRRMSKTQAKKEIKMEEFKRTMKGIKAIVENGTIDESPFAYKNIFDVMKAQKESVRIYKHLKPIINWKGTENYPAKE